MRTYCILGLYKYMGMPTHRIIHFIILSLWLSIFRHQSKQTKIRIKKILHNKKLIKYADMIGSLSGGGYLLILLYSVYRLPIEEDGIRFLYRLAVYGSIVSCLSEVMMFVVSKWLKEPISNIILAMAYAGKCALWAVHLHRIIAPVLLLVYGIVILVN